MSTFFKIRKDGTKAWFYDFMYQGKRYRGIGGTTRTQATRAQEALRSKVISGEYNLTERRGNISIQEFANIYLERRKHIRSWKRDNLSVRTLLKFFKKKSLNSIDANLIEKYILYRMKANVSNGTINRELACLKKMFTLAIKWGEANSNPVKSVSTLEEPPGRTRFLSIEECNRLIQHTLPHLRPIVITALNTGMRLKEILSLQWSQVYIQNVSDPYIELSQTKNNKKRFIPLNDDMVKILNSISNNSEYVFLGTHNKPLSTIHRAFVSSVKRAGIEDFRFHDLRHTFASHFIMNCGDLLALKEILGHSSMKMVERYAHLASEYKRKQINCLTGKFVLPPICHQAD